MKRLRLGDYFTVESSEFCCAMQVIPKHPTVGDMVRVMSVEGELGAGPTAAKDLFCVGFPINAARRAGYLSFVGNFDLPPRFSTIQNLKAPNILVGTDKISSWRLFTKDGMAVVGSLNAEQANYAEAAALNLAAMDDWIKKSLKGLPLF